MRTVSLTLVALALASCTERERPQVVYAPRPEPEFDRDAAILQKSSEPAPVDPLIVDVSERLAGVWRSVEHPESTSTITVNGAWVTSNTGKYPAIEARTYKLYTRLNPPPGVPAHLLEPGKAYIDLKMSAGNIQYEVGPISANKLELVHFFFSDGASYKTYTFERIE